MNANAPAKMKSQRGQPKNRPQQRKIALRKKALYSLVMLVTFFLTVELALWAAGVELLIDREDPFRGFSGLITVYERDGDVYRTHPANSGGTFNDQSFAARKPAAGVRLFCLGGSSSYGFPWGAPAAFTAILGDVLSDAHPDLKIEAVNASGVSYAMHRLNIVADELLDYEPDIFIIYSGHNEFVEPDFFDALKRRSQVRNRVEYLLAHSRLYSGMHSLFQEWSAAQNTAAGEFGARVNRDDMRSFTQKGKEAIVSEFRWRLQRLVRKAHARGVNVILATVPCNLRDWHPEASKSEAVLSEDQSRQWTEAFLSGQSHVERREFQEALDDLRKALDFCDDHAETHFLAARSYEELSKWEQARRAYDLACDYDASPARRISAINDAIRDVAEEEHAVLVDVDRIFRDQSENSLVGFNLIEDYVHPTLSGHQDIAWQLWSAIESEQWLGDTVEVSRERFNQVVTKRGSPVNEGNGVWLYNQGIVLLNQGSYERAIEKFRRALVLLPDHAGALANLAKLLSEKDKSAEALPLARKLVGMNPDHPNYRPLLAKILAQEALDDEAAQHYQLQIARWPRSAEAYTGLGSIYARRGDLALAKEQFEKALSIRSDDAGAHYNLGLIAEKKGDLAGARTSYERALRIQPDHAAAHCNLGTLLFKQGDYTQAEAQYRLAIRSKPNYAVAHCNLGVLLENRGDPSGAESQYRQVLEAEPNHLQALNNLAWLLATCYDDQIRDGEEALRLAVQAAELTHYQQVAYLDTLAAAHAAAGQFAEAVQWQLNLIALVPEQQRVAHDARLELYRRGEAYRSEPREQSIPLFDESQR